MGFDIECIIDILTYPGEYFCPVCRTLVYPNEALQSQCTHLYCKPCLAHVANNTRACPYDGYLVTEADSKPLLESDKTLAENIGKVKVRCLYHRSGCTWEGPLSECTSHCSGCAFGNSPVICNRCGVQIVHRQVHDHAQNCPGAYQVQQVTEAAPSAATSGPTVAPTAVNQSQAAVQSTAPSSQAPNSQNVPAPVQPGQDVNQQSNASSQAPAAVPTPEQWYQQYYQQYGGYDLYQQAYQQYYPYQQSVQHPQQHPAGHGGQPQLQGYSQVPLQAQMPPQSQSQTQPLPHSQSQPQQLVQPQPQAQVQQGFSQNIAHAQSLNPQSQNQPQSTLQQQPHPSMQPHAQIPPQSSAPHSFPAPQAQVHHMQPQPHVPVGSYQQHPQPSQVHLQPHLLTQSQPPSQPQQPHLQHHNHPQIRPLQPNQPTALNIQSQPMHTSAGVVTGYQSYPQPQPLQQAQTAAPQQPPLHAQPASGSVASGPLHGQIPQQPSMFAPPPHGLIPSQQVPFPSQGQLPSMPPAQQQQFHPQAPHPSHSVQQRALAQQYVQQQAPPGLIPGQHQQGNLAVQQPIQSQIRPQGPPHMIHPNPQSHLHLPQNAAVVPGVQPQQTHNYVGRPGIPIQGAPGQQMPPIPQTYGGYGSVVQAKPAQPNQPALAQNYVHTVSNQPQMASDHQLGQPGVLPRQGDHGSEKTGHDGGLPSQSAVEKVATTSRPDADGLKALKSEAGMSYEQDLKGTSNDHFKQKESLATTGAGERKEASIVPLGELKREKEEPNTYLSEFPANDKSGPLVNKKDINGDAYDEELESQKSQNALLNSQDENLHPARTASPSSASKVDGYKHANPERSQQASVSARDQLPPYNREQHMNHYGTSISQQNSSGPSMLQSEVPGHQSRPQGPGPFLQPRNPMNPSEHMQPPLLKQPPDVPFGGVPSASSMSIFGGGPGYFGAPRGPSSAAVDHRDGMMGRPPQHASDGQFVSPNFGNPTEAEMMQSQGLSRFDGQSKLPGTFGRGPFGPPLSGEQSSYRMDGGQRVDSSLRPQDERFKTLPGDHLKPFPKEAPWPIDQDTGPRVHDMQPHGLNYDSGFKLGSGSGGPPRGSFHPPGDPHFSDTRERGKMEFERAHQEFIGRGRDYPGRPPHGFGGSSSALHGRDDIDGREIHSFGEGSRSYNLPTDPLGNSFHENRFPPLPSLPRRGEFDGPENMRFVEHVPSRPPHNHLRRVDPFGQDFPPSHFRRGELGPGNSPNHLRFGDPGSFGPFHGHARMGEFPGPGNHPRDPRFGESFMDNKLSYPPRIGEPGFRSSFSQGFLNDGPYHGAVDPFDKSRKRKPVSMGWCRICKVDCETVEGLDVHSQSREHQKMTMDLVISIKQHNRKKLRVSSDQAVREETNSTTRNASTEGRGIKP